MYFNGLYQCVLSFLLALPSHALYRESGRQREGGGGGRQAGREETLTIPPAGGKGGVGGRIRVWGSPPNPPARPPRPCPNQN